MWAGPQQKEREFERNVQEKYVEASTNECDLNQKTMQALDRLADVYATFEDTWSNVKNETAEGDLPFVEAEEAMDQLAAAQQHQARFQDLDDAACADPDDASQRTIELKRKADDAHDRTRSHRERCWRATKEYMMADDSLGCLAELARDTVSAAHALSCRASDRDNNETKFHRKAVEMNDEWQARCSRRSSEGPDAAEVVLVEWPQ